MKKTLTYIACAILALSTVSCAKVGFSEPEPVGDGVTIQFLTTDLTKAGGVDGIDNENKVNKIDWFVFPFKEDGSAVDSTATALLVGTPIVPASEAQLNPSYFATLTSAQINTIFPTAGSRALVFAVANYTGTYPETKTLKGLLELEVGNTFTDGNRWPHPLKTNDAMLNFVMTGAAEISLTAAQTKVELNRLASKVTVSFTYEEAIVDAHDANLIWKPQYNGPEARVYLSNAIATATLGGPLTSREYKPDSDEYPTKPRDIFEYSYDYLKQLAGDPVYYTYPTKMKAGDDNQPYLKLVLPWYAYDKRDTNPNAAPVKQKEVYYKIALPLDALQESNRYYEYKVHVDIIGSDTEVEIAATYSIFNWWNKGKISSNMATGKYISLDIPKNEYDMYTDSLQILYVASGEVELKVDSIFQYNYSSLTVREDQFMRANNVVATSALRTRKKVSEDDIKGWVSIDEDENILQVFHNMDNQLLLNGSTNTAFDMAPYVYRITLHLKDAGNDTTFDRTIRITQYPAMYVQPYPSDGYVYVNGYYNRSSQSASASNPRYWAFDDSKPSYVPNNGGQNNYVMGSVTGIGQDLGTSNNNTNMYKVKVTSLTGTKYVLGDTRGPQKDLTNLQLNGNYKPAKTDIGSQNMVSPYFMTSSAYSKTILWIRDFERAEKRCAAFQESGYPAGRWRLPTEGEIEFMVNLSEGSLIPSLFMSCPYWAASGRLYDPDSKTFITAEECASIGDNGVRCIYDLWYWGEAPVGNRNADWLDFQD